jgi:hypothetical protein
VALVSGELQRNDQVTVRGISGYIWKIVKRGDRYSTRSGSETYLGADFAVVIDGQNRSHHVLLSEL